jgi:hypothetical protein
MKIIKTNSKAKKLLILTGIYLVSAAIISISVIAFLNNSIAVPTSVNSDTASKAVNASNEAGKTEASVKPHSTDNVTGNKLTDIPLNAENISFSYDEKYCVYLYNGEIYIKDIAKNTTVNTISDSLAINKFILMNDRNIIIYFTTKDTSLNLKTFNIDSNAETLQKTVDIPIGTTIKYVDYSSMLNQVLINIKSGKDGKFTYEIYRINLMKKIYKLGILTLINNMILLNNSYVLYYEDNNNNLFCYPTAIAGFNNKKVNLLGSDLNDNIFVQSLDNKNTIYILKNEKIDKTLNLDDPLYLETYSNNIGVYLIYSNYILNLTGDISKKIPFDKNLKFVGVGGNKIFFRDSGNNIIWENSNI